ncbi:hypothetical protein [Mesorhizobium sp. J428]|uniref:hypothetical protein n=1 Tax=Mesorhizobium sp. J428 TaxID=2898440 RepID=UPI002150B984|nr:hypothetical protein [Mesorhizobium sp. J428]MCR5855990.1 hypothetical protein [Mesorhizobium sp. J428]
MLKRMGLVFALAASVLAASFTAFVLPASAAAEPFVSALTPSGSYAIVSIAPALLIFVFVSLVLLGVPARIAFRAARRWVGAGLTRVSDLFSPRPLPSPS